jgi:hypothetical protein
MLRSSNEKANGLAQIQANVERSGSRSERKSTLFDILELDRRTT